MATSPASRLSGMLNNNGRPIPLALVTEWDQRNLWVLCPYCSSRHHHGGGPADASQDPKSEFPTLGQTRESHCGGGESRRYRLCYPFEAAAGCYWYEVDRENQRFRTVGVPAEEVVDESSEDDSHLEPDEIENLSQGLSSAAISNHDQPRSTDEILEELGRDPKWRADSFISCCVLGDTSGMEQLLSGYDDPILGLKDEEGNDCVALAAMEGHVDVLRMLHKRGQPLNNTNKKGRTPLMEAAFWGRLKAVEWLLKHEADPQARDRKGRNALFFATPSDATTRMRARYSLYVEKPNIADDRRIIQVKLTAFEAREKDPIQGVTGSSGGAFIRASHEISYYEHVESYAVPSEFKTIARLHRGGLFSVIGAASGWRTDFSHEKIIDNDLWTRRVMELCSVLGYELKRDRRDRARPRGSFWASHAEKKLAAYFIDQHVVLPRSITDKVHLGDDEGGQWVSDSVAFQDLAKVQRWPFEKKATIIVSREICEDCKSFLSHIKEALGITFSVEVR